MAHPPFAHPHGMCGINGAKVAVGYCRVSTAGQAAEGVSLDAQKARITAWAEANGYELLGVHVDAGLSGGKADNRPALQTALDAACDHSGLVGPGREPEVLMEDTEAFLLRPAPLPMAGGWPSRGTRDGSTGRAARAARGASCRVPQGPPSADHRGPDPRAGLEVVLPRLALAAGTCHSLATCVPRQLT
jgi:hypothetical protein